MTTKQYIAALMSFLLIFFLQSIEVRFGLRDEIDCTLPERLTHTRSTTEYTADWRYITQPTRYTTTESTSEQTTELPEELLWCITYGGSSADTVSACAMTNDGGVVVCGNTYNTSNGLGTVVDSSWVKPCSYVAKFSSGGQLVWSKGLGGNGIMNAYGVAVLTDGSIIVTGSTGATNLIDSSAEADIVSNAFVYRFSADGTELNRKVFTAESAYFDCCAATNDGKVVLGGTATGRNGDFSFMSSDRGAVLMVLDSNLNTVNSVSLCGSSAARFLDVCVDDNGYIYTVLSTTVSDGDFASLGLGLGRSDNLVSKYSPSLVNIWHTAVAGSGEDNIDNITDNGAGGCAVTGYYRVSGLVGYPDGAFADFTRCGESDGALFLIDSNGNITGKKLIAGLYDDRPNAITRCGDRYYIAGYTYSENRTFVPIGNLGEADSFLFETDLDGNITNMQAQAGFDIDSGTCVCGNENGIFIAGVTSSREAFFAASTPPVQHSNNPFIAKYKFN